MEPPASSVQVFARFRPLSAAEAARADGGSVAHIAGNSVTIGAAAAPAAPPFSFDGVFAPDASQADVYDAVGRPLVRALFAGYNACLMAYGQTGSGKTFSMVGPPAASLGQAAGAASETLDAAAGVIPRAVADIFVTALGAPEECTFSIRASYVEIYQERVRDLLAPAAAAAVGPEAAGASLAIGDDPARGGIYVKGAREEYVGSPGELLALMAAGNANRATAATGMNAGSSRSHALFTLSLCTHDAGTGIGGRAKLLLCDLAGSETVSKTGVTGKQLDELRTINKSLSALGLCVHALTEAQAGGAGARTHVPYRDSKLTRLLQECLGGNSRTALLCAASPSGWNAGETLSTLRFGARAKRVRNVATAHRERTPSETARHADACEGALVALDAAAARALSTLEALLELLPPPALAAMQQQQQQQQQQQHAAMDAAPLAVVAALLAARARVGTVLCGSTSLQLASAAAVLAASDGAGPPLLPPEPPSAVVAAAAGAAGDATSAGGEATTVAVDAAGSGSGGDRGALLRLDGTPIGGSTENGVDGGAAAVGTAELRSAASVAAALERAAVESAAGPPSSSSSSSSTSAGWGEDGRPATDPATPLLTAGHSHDLQAQVADMVELLTEAGGEIGELAARVAALEAELAALRASGAGAGRAGEGAGGREAGATELFFDAASAHSPPAGGTGAAGGAAAHIAVSSVTVDASAAPPAPSSSPSPSDAELSLLRSQLEQASCELTHLRDELCESKAHAEQLEDALMHLAAAAEPAAAAGVQHVAVVDDGARPELALASPATAQTEEAADSAAAGGTGASSDSAPITAVGTGAAPSVGDGASEAQALASTALLSGAHDDALAQLAHELASRNALISAYEGRLTSLITRMADAVAAGDVRLLESAAPANAPAAATGGGAGLGDARSGRGGDSSVQDAPHGVKSIRGRGQQQQQQQRPNGTAAANALRFSPPRGYAPTSPATPGGRSHLHLAHAAEAGVDGGGGAGGEGASPGEGLLGRLWRRVAAATGIAPPLPALLLSPAPPLPSRRGAHAAVSFSTSADLHLLSPARASPLAGVGSGGGGSRGGACVPPAPAAAAAATVASGGRVVSPANSAAVRDAQVLAAAAPADAAAAVSGAAAAAPLEALVRACEAGDVAGVRAALATHAGIAGLPDAHGRTACLHAARAGQLAVLVALVEQPGSGSGALLGAVDREGRDALHYACRKGHEALVAWLLQQRAHGGGGGSDVGGVQRADVHGLTPLHQAALGRSRAVAQLLLEAGADPRAVDLRGASPGDLLEAAAGGGGGGGGGGAASPAERLLALFDLI